MEVMTYIIDNWTVVLTLIFVIIYMVQKIYEFVALPTEKKLVEVKKRLLEWVRAAEADLGGETGAFKLAQVYNTFCEAYPYLKKWFTLEKFEKLVDEALKQMEDSFSNEITKVNALKLK